MQQPSDVVAPYTPKVRRKPKQPDSYTLTELARGTARPGMDELRALNRIRYFVSSEVLVGRERPSKQHPLDFSLTDMGIAAVLHRLVDCGVPLPVLKATARWLGAPLGDSGGTVMQNLIGDIIEGHDPHFGLRYFESDRTGLKTVVPYLVEAAVFPEMLPEFVAVYDGVMPLRALLLPVLAYAQKAD